MKIYVSRITFRLFCGAVLYLGGLLSAARSQEILERLDSGRFVYFNGVNFVYVWLDDRETYISFLIKSDFSPEKMGFKRTGETLSTEKIAVGEKISKK